MPGCGKRANHDLAKLSDIAIAYGIVMPFSAMSVARPNSSAKARLTASTLDEKPRSLE